MLRESVNWSGLELKNVYNGIRNKERNVREAEDVSCLLPHDVVTSEHGVALRVTNGLPLMLLKPAAHFMLLRLSYCYCYEERLLLTLRSLTAYQTFEDVFGLSRDTVLLLTPRSVTIH
jgi:hypothetical protein